MTAQNLLVELFVEELPPKALKKLGDAFAQVLAQRLTAQGLAAPDAVVTPFASPRRLAAHITAVLPRAADRAVSQKLMPVAVGLESGPLYGVQFSSLPCSDLTARYRNLLVAFLAMLFVDSFINGPFWVTTERHLFASVLPLLLAGWRPPVSEPGAVPPLERPA